MENYVGRKCKGFRFEDGVDGVIWEERMKECMGEIGVITAQYEDYVDINFSGNSWHYPISVIEPHLVDVDTNVDTSENNDDTSPDFSCILGTCCHDHFKVEETPEIPQLGEGVEMEVSNDGITWHNRNIIAQMQDGWYIINDGTIWKYARPIQEVKKYTKEELVKILGHDFEMV
jgi:hypothetical protein